LNLSKTNFIINQSKFMPRIYYKTLMLTLQERELK